MNKKILFIFLIAHFTPLFSFEERLKNISLNEKVCMRKFFEYSIKEAHLGHVLLFNHKPMCLISLIVKDKQKTFNDILYLKGWYAFRKNEAYFPHPNFLIIEEKCERSSMDVIDIYVINKKALVACLDTFESSFRQHLGEDFSKEDFLLKLEDKKQLSSEIKNSQVLLGIMLGYGLESSIAYAKRNTANPSNDIPPWTESYRSARCKSLKNNKIYPVDFMGNPNSSEVKELIRIYDLESEEILNEYTLKKDLLILALKHLCSQI